MAEPLTFEQISRQMLAWFDAGLPHGTVSLRNGRVVLELRDTAQVQTWLTALDTTGRVSNGIYGAWPLPRPVALRGMELSVFCRLADPVAAPVEPPLRIEVLA